MLLRAHCVERECRFGAYACLVGLNQLERAAPKGKKVRALLHLMQQGEVAVFSLPELFSAPCICARA